MLNFSKISEKRVLIIDDMEGMRSQLRMSLSSSGFSKLHVVGSIREALDRLATGRYDLILCDYLLGEGTDGQQFLEYLRTNDLISRNTLFIMITAEQSYGKVVAASECEPDDYLLKPFTAAQFNLRLEKLMERQEYLIEIDRASDKKNWAKVVAECDALLARKDKYYFDLAKIKGSALMKAGNPGQAAEFYRSILAVRPLGWAKLGLARALSILGEKSEAESLARKLIEEMPQFMATYDFLGKVVADSGDRNGALDILQKAREIAPGTMSRIRELTSLAVSTGQPEIAEKVMRETLQRHKYSPVKQAGDYVILSRALVDQGRAEEALGVVKEAKKSFRDDQSNVLLATTESRVHRAAGNDDLAREVLDAAMGSVDPRNLSPDVVMAMADACFSLGREEDATRLLKQAVQSNHEDESIRVRVRDLMIAAGKDLSEVKALIDASAKEVIHLNNEGVRKAQAGELGDAVEMLSEAAERLPNNLQILGNVALVIALDMVKNGRDSKKMAKCLGYRDSLMKKSPSHPKIEQIDSMLKQLKT